MDTITFNNFFASGGRPSANWTGDVVAVSSTAGGTTPGPCNIYFRRSILSFTYTSAELSTAFGKNSATIRGLRFYVVTNPIYQPLGSYAIGMKLVSTDPVTNPGYNGYTIVKNQSSESFTGSSNKVFQPLTTSFTWTSGNNLAITFAWAQSPTSWSSNGTCYINNGGYIFYSWVDSAGVYTINSDTPASAVANSRPVMQLYG